MLDLAPRVLVVHRRSGRTLLDRTLRLWGFQPLWTDDPEHALWLVAELVPAAVVLDLDIAGLDVLHVAEALRAHRPTRGVPILAITSFAAGQGRDLTLRRGCDRVFAAPVDADEIAAELERSVAGAGSRAHPPPEVGRGALGLHA